MFRLLVLRSLVARPLRALLSTFGIVLGVAAILAIGTVNQNAVDAVTRAFSDSSGNASLVVVSNETGDRGMPQSVVRRIAAISGVALAVPRLQQQTVLASEAPPAEIGLTFFGASSGGLTLQGVDPTLDPQVRTYRLVAGRFLADDAEALEVVLVDTLAEEENLRLDGPVQVRVADGVATMRIVGLMAREGPGLLGNGSFGVLPLATAQKLFGREGELDQVDVVAVPGNSDAAAVAALKIQLSTALGEDYAVTYPAAQGQRTAQMLGSYQIGLNFLGGIALFVGAFLIYNAFTMSVAERTRQLGMLRTIGMTRAQVALQVLSEAACLGVVGCVAGLGLGLLLSRGLAAAMSLILSQDLGTLNLQPLTVATSLGVGLGATVVAALVPAWQASRTSPLEALRSRSRSNEGWIMRHGPWLGLPLLVLSAIILVLNPFSYDVQFRLGSLVVFALFVGAALTIPVTVSAWERITRPFVSRVYGTVGRLGSGNIRRSRWRTTLTVTALMVGVAMIIVVRGMTESFKSDLKAWLNAYVGGDIYVSASVPMRSRVRNRLEVVEGVAAVAPVRYVETTWIRPDGQEEALSFMAIEPAIHSQVTTFVFSGETVSPSQALQQLQDGGALLVSSVLAEKYALAPGATIQLRTRMGPAAMTVAGVVVDFYNQGLVVTGSWDDMRRFFRVSDANAYLLKVAPGYAVDEVRQRIDQQYGKQEQLSVEANRAIKDRVFRLMDQAFVLFDLMALIAVAVASLGVINTLMMNVTERTQEIGMLRAVGMTRRQVMGMVLAESGVMGGAAGVLGLVFGIILTRIFLTAMTAMSGYKLTYVMPIAAAITALVIGVLVSQLAALWPARQAARVRVLEAIHYE